VLLPGNAHTPSAAGKSAYQFLVYSTFVLALIISTINSFRNFSTYPELNVSLYHWALRSNSVLRKKRQLLYSHIKHGSINKINIQIDPSTVFWTSLRGQPFYAARTSRPPPEIAYSP